MKCRTYPEVDVSVVVVTAKDPCVRCVTLTSSITIQHIARMTATDSQGQHIRITLRERDIERKGRREREKGRERLCMLHDGRGGSRSDNIQIVSLEDFLVAMR